MRKFTSLFLLLSLFWMPKANSWGFFGHKLINRVAVFTLPPEMLGFYKRHIQYITENAVNPDRRRYAVDGEAPRHYIDIDVYGDSAIMTMPRKWEDAVKKYTVDTLMAYGIVPWHIVEMKRRLTYAFRNKDVDKILLLSADLGHYIGDGNVPLHTTENYNGQKTGQYGIHGFWESRLPELYSEEYDLFVGRAEYVKDPTERAWNAVINANRALDSVFGFEKLLTEKMGDDLKYNFETRGRITMKVYSKEFSKAYHNMLNGQVERQMRAAIKMVGDFWYTCWVDAGKPNLEELYGNDTEKEPDPKEFEVNPDIKTREHETFLRKIFQKEPTFLCCCEKSHHQKEHKTKSLPLGEFVAVVTSKSSPNDRKR
jgi:hypothetical protein